MYLLLFELEWGSFLQLEWYQTCRIRQICPYPEHGVRSSLYLLFNTFPAWSSSKRAVRRCASRLLLTTMSVSQPLLDTIEADEPSLPRPVTSNASQAKNARTPVVLTPTNRTTHGTQMATTESDAESGMYSFYSWVRITELIIIFGIGIAGIFRQVCLVRHFRSKVDI